MLIVGCAGSRKTNALLNLIIIHKPDIDKIYLYEKDAFELKYQLLIYKRESAVIKHLNDSKALLNTQIIWMIFIKILKNTI